MGPSPFCIGLGAVVDCVSARGLEDLGADDGRTGFENVCTRGLGAGEGCMYGLGATVDCRWDIDGVGFVMVYDRGVS